MAKKKSHTNKQSKSKNPKKPEWEMIEYVDYLDDPKKQKAANMLAYSGWNKENPRRGAITATARQVGVNRATIYEWLKDEKMVTAVEEAKHELCAMAMNGLRELVKEKNFGACAFLLERLQPEQFSHQYRKFELDVKMLELQNQMGTLTADVTPPTIIIESPSISNAQYERNKLKED